MPEDSMIGFIQLQQNNGYDYDKPTMICSGPMTSPKKILAMTPADIGSKVAVILAGVGRILLMPSK